MTWATKLAGVSLVQERLDEAKVFYGDVFGLQAVHEDESNAVFKIGPLSISWTLRLHPICSVPARSPRHRLATGSS